MAIYRIYTDVNGVSRIEPRDLTSPLPVRSFFLKEFPAGTVLDWHPAPRRQVVVVLSGELENHFRDGGVYRFGPGDTRVIEDVTGEGHRTRVVGDAPCLVAVMPLAE